MYPHQVINDVIASELWRVGIMVDGWIKVRLTR